MACWFVVWNIGGRCTTTLHRAFRGGINIDTRTCVYTHIYMYVYIKGGSYLMGELATPAPPPPPHPLAALIAGSFRGSDLLLNWITFEPQVVGLVQTFTFPPPPPPLSHTHHPQQLAPCPRPCRTELPAPSSPKTLSQRP